MQIDTMDKVKVLTTVFRPVMDALGGFAPEGGSIDADDVIDFFAMGIAAIIDNDTDLKTPRDLRLAAEEATKLIQRRTNEFRDMQDQAGMSWFSVVMMGSPDPSSPPAKPTVN